MTEAIQPSAPKVARGANLDERSRPRFLAAGATDRGRVRVRNEDAVLVRPELGLFLVADGVSGASPNAGGALAAQVAVGSIAGVVERAKPEARRLVPEEVLRGAVQLACGRVSEEGTRAGFPEMATTVAALLVEGSQAFVAHVGDSRVYRLRQGALERLTVDHTLAGEWEAKNQRAAPPDVRAHGGHVLTRWLGGAESGVKVDVRAVSWQPGDVFLLCSDGLHGLVDDEDMADVITRAPDLDLAVVRLLKRANEAAGHDNIAAVLVRMPGA
jgi:protein phosphatase